MFDVLELHRRLKEAARPSGTEATGIAKVLRELAQPLVDEITTDAIGNLICHKKGTGKRVELAAHMDAIGFIVTGIGDDGFLSIAPIGGHDAAEVIGHRVVFANGTHGVIAPCEKAKTLSGSWGDINFRKLYLDIGAKSKKEAESLVAVGDMAAYEGMPRAVAGHRIMGPYADDLIGCVVLLMAMEQVKNSPYDIYCVFTVQEEVGTRGGQTSAMGIQPDIAIACDVCNTHDKPSDNCYKTLVLGEGPTLKIKDYGIIGCPALNAALKKVADKLGIHCQSEILLGGSTDAGAMQMAGPSIASTCVSIPTRYVHSPNEMYDRRDAEQAAALLAGFLNEEGGADRV